MKTATTLFLGLMLMATAGWTEDNTPPTGMKAKGSYSLGYQFGSNLKTQEIAIDREVLFKAIQEGLEGKTPALSTEDIQATMNELRSEAMTRVSQRRELQSAKNKADGEQFLAVNKTKAGVKTLPSGLQYLVLKAGNGPHPQLTDIVMVNYQGSLLDGTVFDSSYARGIAEKVYVNGVIKGWTEALPLMKTGAKWRLFVPAELAYGERAFSRIPSNSTLIFEIELLSVEKFAGRNTTKSATNTTVTEVPMHDN